MVLRQARAGRSDPISRPGTVLEGIAARVRAFEPGSCLPMRASVLSILACVALAASACGPSGQAPGGGAAPGNVTVATPPPAAAATPAGAATPATGATTKPAATAAAKPTTQPAAQPSGPQEISVNALQGEPDNLDQNRSSFYTEGAVIRQVFEPLL